MESFLHDLLIADKKDKSDLSEKIQVIKREITSLKSATNKSMKNKCTELESNLKPDKLLINKSEKIIDDIQILQNQINNEVISKLVGSSKELQDLSLELKEYNYSLQLSNHLLEIHKAFEFIQVNCNNKDNQFTDTAKILVKLYNLIIENSSDIRQLSIYSNLKEEYNQYNDNFVERLMHSWQDNIYWDVKKDTLNTKSVTLSIKCQENELIDIIQALDYMKKLNKYIELLSTKMLQNFIKPIILCECTVKSSNKSLFLQIIDKKQVPNYKTVLSNLKLFFEFFHQYFNIPIENEKCFLTKFSNSMFEEFSKLLTNDCIFKIIPTSSTEVENFKNIVFEIKEFQNYLIDIKFMNEDQTFLSKYTNNIDELYIDKKVEKLLETARIIMKKDLHDSIKYKSKSIEKFSKDEIDVSNKLTDPKLSKYFFHFPECQISKSAEEILGLVHEILEEACLNSDKYFYKLFYTTRNIFEMYAALVPEIHKSYLDTIPQQVALFHNNCLYLAHHLLTLPYKYKKKMELVSQDFLIIYADQHLLLQNVGTKYFLNHMKYQRDIIFDILRESGLSTIGQMPELPVTTERALRQCIRQLELLKTVWIEILPIKMYCRVLGCIVNDMIDDIIAKIINVEDIPANVASELVTLFNMVSKRIPQIFPKSIVIEQNVLKWRRLKELIIILGASLKEIEDRWADGKGPLANEFSPQHVKQLIRALFQNTDRRSNLLSKIKDK